MMPRPQFRLRSLFILTAVVVLGCLVGQWGVRRYREYQTERLIELIQTTIVPASGYTEDGHTGDTPLKCYRYLRAPSGLIGQDWGRVVVQASRLPLAAETAAPQKLAAETAAPQNRAPATSF